jgi:hypothetical protein
VKTPARAEYRVPSVWTLASSPALLRTVAPHCDLKGVDVGLTGLLNPSIEGMVAHQTCARF